MTQYREIDADDHKKAYKRPALVVYGPIAQLTMNARQRGHTDNFRRTRKT